jgi:hypothetical protein
VRGPNAGSGCVGPRTSTERRKGRAVGGDAARTRRWCDRMTPLSAPNPQAQAQVGEVTLPSPCPKRNSDLLRRMLRIKGPA